MKGWNVQILQVEPQATRGTWANGAKRQGTAKNKNVKHVGRNCHNVHLDRDSSSPKMATGDRKTLFFAVTAQEILWLYITFLPGVCVVSLLCKFILNVCNA